MRRRASALVALSLSASLLASLAAFSPRASAHVTARLGLSWIVMDHTKRAVVSDRTSITIGGGVFTVARFYAGATAFHWHAGYLDPPHAATSFAGDTVSHVSWASEGVVGVVGVLNGGFKATASAGGVMADNVTLVPMQRGLGTIAINRFGAIKIGKWGRDLPGRKFHAVSYRQNLALLVDHGSENASSRLR